MRQSVLATAGKEMVTQAFRDLSARLNLNITPIGSFADDLERLEASPPEVVLVDAKINEFSEVCIGLRMSANLAETPIIVMLDDPWSEKAAAVFGYGADDYVLRNDLDQFEKKILALRTSNETIGSRLSGKVVLADPSRERRLHLARYLRKMGLDVHFSVELDDVPDHPGIKLVVAHDRLPPEGVSQGLKAYRQGEGKKIPWIVFGTDMELTDSKEKLVGEPNIVFFGVESDPAQIVFAANQMLIGAGHSLRRSPRLQYGTPVCFNAPVDTPAWGYTYNINRGGLYVRTITPPQLATSLKLEFTPPYGTGHVVVEGRVVWRQEYSTNLGYPPGFGVQYTSLPLADGAALNAGYTKLFEDSGEKTE